MIKLLVGLHVLAGSVAVLGMLWALFSKKGGPWHKKGGRAYTFGMAASLLMATIVSVLTSNIFLLLIALFSSYLVYTGWRLVVARDGVGNGFDHNLSILMMAVAFTMVVYGFYMLFIQGESLGIALIVFGFFAGTPALQDFKRATVWPKGKERILLHLGRMGGACIATVTAVFVVNVGTNPAFIAWLLPSLLGTPLIAYWTKRTLAGKM